MRTRLAFDASFIIACVSLLAVGVSFASASSPAEHAAKAERSVSAGLRGGISSAEIKASPAEIDAIAALRFDRLDRGDKGYLTLDDFRVYARGFLDNAMTDPHPTGGKSVPPYELAFRAINKANDGHLTKAEYLSASRARIAELQAGKAAR